MIMAMQACPCSPVHDYNKLPERDLPLAIDLILAFRRQSR